MVIVALIVVLTWLYVCVWIEASVFDLHVRPFEQRFDGVSWNSSDFVLLLSSLIVSKKTSQT